MYPSPIQRDLRLGKSAIKIDRLNARVRAVMERIDLTYVLTFPTSMTSPVAGVEEGEVEYEMTRDQWERATT